MACFICFVQFLPQLVSPRASWFGRLAKAAHGCGPVARTCLGPTHDYPNNIQWSFKQCFKYSFCIFWIFLVLLSSVNDAKDKYHFSIPTFSSQILQIVESSSLCDLKLLWVSDLSQVLSKMVTFFGILVFFFVGVFWNYSGFAGDIWR
jgi:hypothetical protein